MFSSWLRSWICRKHLQIHRISKIYRKISAAIKDPTTEYPVFMLLMNTHHILVIQGLNIFREMQKCWEKHSFFVIVGKCLSRVDVFDVLGSEVTEQTLIKGCSQMTWLSPLPPWPASVVSFFLYWCSPLLSSLAASYQEPQTTVIHNPAEATKVHRSCSRCRVDMNRGRWGWNAACWCQVSHGTQCLWALWAGKPVWHQRHIQRPSMILEKNVFSRPSSPNASKQGLMCAWPPWKMSVSPPSCQPTCC